jgi:hypothetical protein
VETSQVPTSSVGVIQTFGSVRPAVCCRPHGQSSAAKHSHVRHRTLHCFRPQPTDTQFLRPVYKEVRKCAHKAPNMARSLKRPPSTAHQIFCPRPFAKNARVHVTWQTLLSDSTQTVASADKGQQNPPIFVQPFAGRCRPTNTVPTLLQLCLLMRQKAAIGTNPVTPAEHKTTPRTGCSANLRL